MKTKKRVRFADKIQYIPPNNTAHPAQSTNSTLQKSLLSRWRNRFFRWHKRKNPISSQVIETHCANPMPYALPPVSAMPKWEWAFTVRITYWHMDFPNMRNWEITDLEYDFIRIYCSAFSIRKSKLLRDAIKTMSDSYPLYKVMCEILQHLKQEEAKPYQTAQSRLDRRFQRWYRIQSAANPPASPASPDFTLLSRKPQRQEKMKQLWGLCSDTCTYENHIQALLSLHLQWGSRKITAYLNRLLPAMDARQIGVAQMLVFHLYRHDPASFLRKNADDFDAFLNLCEQNGDAHHALFADALVDMHRIYTSSNLNFLAHNLQTVQAWCKAQEKRNLKYPLDTLFNEALEVKGSIQKSYAQRIALEMINVSKRYYAKVPLSEFCTTTVAERAVTNEMISYCNRMYNYLLSKILFQPENKIKTALSFIIKIAQGIYTHGYENGFMDFTSLETIYQVIENHNITRICAGLPKISREERKFIEQLSQRLSLSNNYKNMRQFSQDDETTLPAIALLTKDIQHAIDGNPQLLHRYQSQGAIIARIAKLKNQLSPVPPCFSTDILLHLARYQEIEEPSLYAESCKLRTHNTQISLSRSKAPGRFARLHFHPEHKRQPLRSNPPAPCEQGTDQGPSSNSPVNS